MRELEKLPPEQDEPTEAPEPPQEPRDFVDASPPPMQVLDPVTGRPKKSVRVRVPAELAEKIRAAPPEERAALAEFLLATRAKKKAAVKEIEKAKREGRYAKKQRRQRLKRSRRRR